jgi:hypothetical protein
MSRVFVHCGVRHLGRVLASLVVAAVLVAFAQAGFASAELRFAAIPAWSLAGVTQEHEYFVSDLDFLGVTPPYAKGTWVEVIGELDTGSGWVTAFQSFQVQIPTTGYFHRVGVTFPDPGDARLTLRSVDEIADDAVLLLQIVTPPTTTPVMSMHSLMLGAALPDSVTAGTQVEIEVDVVWIPDLLEEDVEVVDDFEGGVYLTYTTPGDFGYWESTTIPGVVVDGRATFQVYLTSVVHAAMRVWIDPLDWTYGTPVPSIDIRVAVLPSEPVYVSMLLGDMVGFEDTIQQRIVFEHDTRVAVLDEYGNFCDVEGELVIEFTVEDAEEEPLEVEDFEFANFVPPTEYEAEEMSVMNSGGSSSESASALSAPAVLAPLAPASSMTSSLSQSGLVFIPYNSPYGNYSSGLGAVGTLSFSVSSSAALPLIVVVSGANLGTSMLSVSPPFPIASVLGQVANAAVANASLIGAKHTGLNRRDSTGTHAGKYAWEGSPPRHGGSAYAWTTLYNAPNALQHRADPGACWDTSPRGEDQKMLGPSDPAWDFISTDNLPHVASRRISAEIVWDTTLTQGKNAEARWDVYAEYGSTAYGNNSQGIAWYYGKARTYATVVLSVPNNTVPIEKKAEAAVDHDWQWVSTPLSIGAGPVSWNITLPASTGQETSGDREQRIQKLEYLATGQTGISATIATAIVASAERMTTTPLIRPLVNVYRFEIDSGMGLDAEKGHIKSRVVVDGVSHWLPQIWISISQK